MTSIPQLLWFLLAPAIAQPAVEPPLVNRPPHFSNIVGQFRLSATANPTQVLVEEPITLTVRLTGSAMVPYVPKREDLQIFAQDPSEDFYVEPVPEEDQASAKEWSFVYRLRPKHVGVTSLPALHLTYYSPIFRRYQTTLPTEELPKIAVKARPAPKLAFADSWKTEVPEGVKHWVEKSPFPERSGAIVPEKIQILLIALPPLVLGGWLVLRRHFRSGVSNGPMSSAGRRAVTALRQRPAEEVLADYLREGWHFPSEQITPREVGRFLKTQGVRREIYQAWEDFFRARDLSTFAGDKIQAPAGEPTHLLEMLEAEIRVMAGKMPALRGRV